MLIDDLSQLPQLSTKLRRGGSGDGGVSSSVILSVSDDDDGHDVGESIQTGSVQISSALSYDPMIVHSHVFSRRINMTKQTLMTNPMKIP